VSVRLESAGTTITSRATLRTNSPLHVLIVGASYGGLCLAHGLRRAGVSCALYEARPGLSDGSAGSRVVIDPMGNRALQECLPSDLFAAFLAATARAPGRPSSGLERQPLRRLLLTGLADRLHFGKMLTHYERQADGTVTAFFADGGSASGQVLVAADGARSSVRDQYLRELTPRRHLNLRRFYPAADPGSAFPLQIVSAELAPAWLASNVTLVGDAIHAATPGPRAGANTALRDAMLLSRALSFVQADRVGLHNAVAAYETEMVRFNPARATSVWRPQ
jgi:2-polyprenyl-6-methoxyphenol hydroxylase-like FAD-dependent oxidoreductase